MNKTGSRLFFLTLIILLISCLPGGSRFMIFDDAKSKFDTLIEQMISSIEKKIPMVCGLCFQKRHLLILRTLMRLQICYLSSFKVLR
jgi:hypothetical protein